MNLQLLDWFVKVVRHGGISQTVRELPHSIQQPTLSEHMAELEAEIGTRLFIRHPFRLLDAGRELFELADPFLAELSPLLAHLRDRRVHLRIAACELVHPRTLGRLVRSLRLAYPGLQCTVLSTPWPDPGPQLRSGALDVAISPCGDPPPAGVSSRTFSELPLVLLAPRDSPVRRAEELWTRGTIAEPLICPGPQHAATQAFAQALRQAKLTWIPTIEADSLIRVAELVAAGTGFGLGLLAPWLIRRPGVRVLRLGGFQPVRIAVFWKNPTTAAIRDVVQLAAGLEAAESDSFERVI